MQVIGGVLDAMKTSADQWEESAYEAVVDGSMPPWPTVPASPARVQVRFRSLSLVDRRETEEDEKRVTVTKTLLYYVSGTFKPGTMTLVLGQPGSGKSVLLSILAGRRPYCSTIKVYGDITYNGVPREELLQSKTMPHIIGHVAQGDQHLPSLTVKETLQFAQKCGGTSSKQVDDVAAQLGLDLSPDTGVGDTKVGDLSDRDRKLLTIAEMAFGTPLVTFMDDISTGLDRATTFQVVSTQRRLVNDLQKTVIMALERPEPEVLELFDDILLLAEGQVLYYGPRDQVAAYFQSLGLECRPDRTLAEFLVNIGTRSQAQYVSTGESPTVMGCAELATRFRESNIFLMDQEYPAVSQAETQDLKSQVQKAAEFPHSFSSCTKWLLQREIRSSWRDLKYVAGRLALLIVIGFIEGSLFYDLDLKKVETVEAALTAVVLLVVFTQGTLAPSFLGGREVFYKQRDANFYPTSSYVSAVAINQIPFALLEAFILTAIVYWMFGLVSTTSGFVGMAVVFFFTSTAFCSLIFLLSSLTATAVRVIAPSLTIVFTIFGGIFLTRANIESFFIWIYWANPIGWGVRAISVQQYASEQLKTCVYDGLNYCELFGKTFGEYTLESFDIPPSVLWFWAGLGFLLAMTLVCYVLSALALECLRDDSSPESHPFDFTTSKPQDPSSTTNGTNNEHGASPNPTVGVSVTTTSVTDRLIPVTLAFENVRYSVPDATSNDKKNQQTEQLKGISGYAKPGTITAIMGSAGAGKTTLMDIIAGRKTGGTIEGRFFLNGHDAPATVVRCTTGYCEQSGDNHCETATVREAFAFSALLRQNRDVSEADKLETVEECLDLLNLRPIADKRLSECSLEEKKRAAIGVELAAHVSVLFLDEPTAGLDAFDAKLVVDAVRKVANSGRTIVCTLHQPSTDVLQTVDSLLVLNSSGETVFFGELGPHTCELIEYFESIDSVRRMRLGDNPAAWMLDVIQDEGVDGTRAIADFASIYEASDKKRRVDWLLSQDGMMRPMDGVSAVVINEGMAAHPVQAKCLLHRFFRTHGRLYYNFWRFVIASALGILLGFSLNKFRDTRRTFNSIYGILSTTSIVVVSLTAIWQHHTILFTIKARSSVHRELANRMYSSFWYCFASSILEIPYVFVLHLMCPAFGFGMPHTGNFSQFALYSLHSSLYLLLQTYIGETIALAAPSEEVATALGWVNSAVNLLFMGLNPTPRSIPSWCKWLHTIVPAKYTMASLAGVLLGGCDKSNKLDLGCRKWEETPVTLPANITSAEYVDLVFDIKRDDLWFNAGVIVGYIMLTRVVVLMLLRFVQYEKRR